MSILLGNTETAADELPPLPPLLPLGLLARVSSCGSVTSRLRRAWRNAGTVSGTAGPPTGAGVASARVAHAIAVVAMNLIVNALRFEARGFGVRAVVVCCSGTMYFLNAMVFVKFAESKLSRGGRQKVILTGDP